MWHFTAMEKEFLKTMAKEEVREMLIAFERTADTYGFDRTGKEVTLSNWRMNFRAEHYEPRCNSLLGLPSSLLPQPCNHLFDRCFSFVGSPCLHPVCICALGVNLGVVMLISSELCM